MKLFTYSPVFLQRTPQLSRQPTVTAVSEEVICVPGALRIERLTNTSRVRTLITTWQYLLHMQRAYEKTCTKSYPPPTLEVQRH
jgi:hypothetical protein